jgi:transketolase
VLIGDGECQEGTMWESAIIAARYELSNLIVFVDNNNLQAMEKLLYMGSISEKFRTFGWDSFDIDGHSTKNMSEVFNRSEYFKYYNRPIVFVAHTIKGKGVKFMENVPDFHAKQLSKEEFERAYKELENA